MRSDSCSKTISRPNDSDKKGGELEMGTINGSGASPADCTGVCATNCNEFCQHQCWASFNNTLYDGTYNWPDEVAWPYIY